VGIEELAANSDHTRSSVMLVPVVLVPLHPPRPSRSMSAIPPITTELTRRNELTRCANTGSRKSSGVTCVSLHAPRTEPYLGDDAVGFFDMHENLGACRSQRDPCHCKRPSPNSTIYALLLFLLGRSISGHCDKRKKKSDSWRTVTVRRRVTDERGWIAACPVRTSR
jgi:hypothetical protein